MEKNKNKMNNFYLPLMSDNIDKSDIKSVIDFLASHPIPKLTNGPKVVEFENAWGKWLGTKYNIMVNSGASANELTMLALKYIYGEGKIIVPPLTWISDVSSVLFAGFDPVFVDINLKNLSFDIDKLKAAITPQTKAIFLTHVLGINGLTDELIELCNEKGILLIEDVCESHGVTFKGQKVGSIGFASNFSFFFAHHMSTIEGGMVCTDNEYFYQVCRALRSHGMTREMTDDDFKQQIINENPDLNKDFIFLAPAHNFRSTEINAVIGLSQIEKLDTNNSRRIDNFSYFIENLDSNKYITDLEMEGQCNYAFIVILKEPSFELRDKVEKTLNKKGIEFRRGLSGGGNQLRQPYFKKNYNINYDDFKNVDHVHHFGWYIGNYPTLEQEKIDTLLNILNNDIS
jgi:CDP-6-deoxy-D-xylo-4-hexulose-3-dehydrase